MKIMVLMLAFHCHAVFCFKRTKSAVYTIMLLSELLWRRDDMFTSLSNHPRDAFMSLSTPDPDPSDVFMDPVHTRKHAKKEDIEPS